MKRKLSFPVIPPKEVVLNLLHQTDNLKHKAIFMLIYGSGLRVSKVAQLKISDICSKTMRIRVDHAKHDTNRYTILSQNTLKILRVYFKKEFAHTGYNRNDRLFPEKDKIGHYHVKSIKSTFIKIRDKMG
jgi:site-specific recombinase XerD